MGSAGSWGKPLNGVSTLLGTLTDSGQGTRFSGAGAALQPLNLVARCQDLLDGFTLRHIQPVVSFRERNSFLDGHELGRSSLPLPYGTDDLFFCLDCPDGSEVTAWRVLTSADLAKLARGNPGLEVCANFRVSHLAHPATHRVNEDGAFIKYCL